MDLDADGNLDLLSGSWPGEIFLFRGGPGHTFAKPEKLKHATGRSINIGGGVRTRGDQVLVSGDATFSEDGKSILYDGETIEIPAGKSGAISGTASVVHAADWDDDGDLDLIVGNIDGRVHLVPNEGTAKAWSFGHVQALTVGGEAVDADHHAGPTVADWDGDGDLDLVVGKGDGGVVLYRNDGTRKEPRLLAAETLVPAAPQGEIEPDAEQHPGWRTKPCVADWNGDGRADLLVGDFAMVKLKLPEPTPEEKAEREAAQKELEQIYERFSEVGDSPAPAAPEERKKLEEEMEALSKRMTELQAKIPEEQEAHGWVWFFARRPVSPVVGGG